LNRASWLLFLGVLIVLILAACAGGGSADEAAGVAAAYVTALVGRDGSQLSTLSCADWESQAVMELDSFQAVETRLEDLSCQLTGTEKDESIVTCSGKIIASYNGEDMQIDLSKRPFVLVKQGGEWQVCGYK
jgi:hypothetical protein